MFAQVFKLAPGGDRSEASRKAWLKRARALRHGGKGVGWQSADGKPLTAVQQANLASVRIPPAWTDVMLASDANPDLVVLGFDGKGRPQPIYSSDHHAEAAIAKFARVSELTAKMPKLMKQSQKDMLNTKLDQRQRDNAATVYLTARTAFRPGSTREMGTDHQAFGASTLEKRHIKVKGDSISFDFIGKKGVNIVKTIKDAPLAAYLADKMQSLKPADKVFQTSSASAMSYLRSVTGPNFKLKDLRTWNATALAANLVAKEPVPDSDKALADQKRRIAKAVSEHLGNTPKIALDSYIDPAVWRSTAGMTKLKKA